MADTNLITIALILILPLLWVFRDMLPFGGSKRKPAGAVAAKATTTNSDDNEDDFYSKMQEGNKRAVVFYGSQTGTAQEYALRLAKEAKSRFGVSSLVCDPEEYESFTSLDRIKPEQAAIFVMATHGEGDPTDNAEAFMSFLMDEDVQFSNGNTLDNLNYVIFGCGNRTYELYNEVARKLDKRLTELGATRIGKRGEGDDDKSMEEDYLDWKESMWDAFADTLSLTEGGTGDSADFVIKECPDIEDTKVFRGELSNHHLQASAKGISYPAGSYDAKNPYAAPVAVARELFAIDGDRNAVHIELDITGANITYQHGDHVAIWPCNPDIGVERFLAVLGLQDKRHTPIEVESLDPALAPVPFPTPATYEAILRHYLDIAQIASRQAIGILAQYAPTPEAKANMERWGKDKAAHATEIEEPRLRLGEVLQKATGDDHKDPSKATPWPIPFDRILSLIPRLQPRYYSISSSPKLYPNTIHVTAVVLLYETPKSKLHDNKSRYIFGLGTAFILNLKNARNSAKPMDGVRFGGLVGSEAAIPLNGMPTVYNVAGPRDFHIRDNVFRVPMHVRRATFRMPNSTKLPIIMIGPGTGIAPFRGFVQERVALARAAKKRNGPDALKDWAPMYLFYGCRKEDEDFLYREEWPEYLKELDGTLVMYNAFSRGPDRQPDGSKIYVQDLIWQQREKLTRAIAEQRGYVYICGDGKRMAKAVEERLAQMLGEAKGGGVAEGMKEVKNLKDKKRYLSDVWS